MIDTDWISASTWTTKKTSENLQKCVDDGFTCVMIDGSKYPFKENVALTSSKVVEYAHAKGVVVEAQTKRLYGIEDNINVDDERLRPHLRIWKKLQSLWRGQGVDSLAIAIGTSPWQL